MDAYLQYNFKMALLNILKGGYRHVQFDNILIPL